MSPHEVFAVLSADVDRCFRLLDLNSSAPEEAEGVDHGASQARGYILAAFACIEGMTFCMTAWAAEQMGGASGGGDAPSAQTSASGRWAALESDVAAMFTRLDQIVKIEPQLGIGRQWWASFQNAIQLRHRLAHPQVPDDLVLAREDILAIVDADAGFRLLLSRYLEA